MIILLICVFVFVSKCILVSLFVCQCIHMCLYLYMSLCRLI